MKVKFSEAKIEIESNALVVRRESADFISGTERMVAVGGGVRARLGKTKDGKTLVQEFIFDRDRFSENTVDQWIEKNSKTFEESVSKIQENAPKGSFQDITMRLINSLNKSGFFNDEYGNNSAYIAWVFPGYFIAEAHGQYFKVDYTETSEGIIELGGPVPADMEFIAKESTDYKEKFERKNRPNCEIEESFKTKIKEQIDTEKREVMAVLIESGTNFAKKRHYPKRTIQESAPLFAGLKMYVDHPTQREEQEKPERSLREWVATITESWYEDGSAIGRIKVHSDWL